MADSIIESSLESVGGADSVTVRMARKFNLGDYEMLDVDISVTSFQKENEHFGDTFNRVFDFVEAKLDEKASIVEGT